MKKILLILGIIFSRSYLSSAKCGWTIFIWVYNDGIVTNQFSRNSISPFYVTMGINDSLHIAASGSYSCTDRLILMHNVDTIYDGGLWLGSYDTTFTDTGHYFLKYQNSDMITFWMTYDLYVSGFIQTGVETTSLSMPLKVYPLNSNGIFSIESGPKLKELIISDVAGRIYSVRNCCNITQMDLSLFSSGIYFYYITDEKNKVWRGKLLKN